MLHFSDSIHYLKNNDLFQVVYVWRKLRMYVLRKKIIYLFYVIKIITRTQWKADYIINIICILLILLKVIKKKYSQYRQNTETSNSILYAGVVIRSKTLKKNTLKTKCSTLLINVLFIPIKINNIYFALDWNICLRVPVIYFLCFLYCL